MYALSDSDWKVQEQKKRNSSQWEKLAGLIDSQIRFLATLLDARL